ncbi:MAG: hypothetical protein BWX87_00950 [Bacteroidetes bacterium ADurb.Bin123]|jgi:hypothetical protein|nr:MAG: hypothetical protein BWX87_00950 [Bacteroidetes bacterium ADurb.Bin123]
MAIFGNKFYMPDHIILVRNNGIIPVMFKY